MTGTPEVGEYDAWPDGPRPVLRWRFAAPVLAVATAVLGGGTGLREWVINVEVGLAYDGLEPEADLARVAAAGGLDPRRGVGLLTAAPVRDYRAAAVDGVEVVATVGLSHPIRAADPCDLLAQDPVQAGTINLVALVPVALAPGGLTNTLVTATEAKVQALQDAGLSATGTASDATVVCCPPPGPGASVEPFGGPRSRWGHRLALATHAAVHAGALAWRERHP